MHSRKTSFCSSAGRSKCEGVLKSFWSGAVSKQPGLRAVPQQEQAKLIFNGNTGAASEWGYHTGSPGGMHLLNECIREVPAFSDHLTSLAFLRFCLFGFHYSTLRSPALCSL